MCGRFALYSSLAEIRKFFGIERCAVDPGARYNIAPGDDVLAIIGSGGLRAGALRWGLAPPRQQNGRGAAKLVINARRETLSRKSMFKNLLLRRRCAIPADGFYEWKRQGAGRQAYFLQPAAGGLIAFAGLWDTVPDPAGPASHCCTIITTAASPQVGHIHDRMPVVLAPADLGRWLDPAQRDAAELGALLLAGRETPLTCRPVGKDFFRQQPHSS